MSKFDRMSPWNQLARCVVNPNHTVAYYLDPNNSNYKMDGTPVDWEEVEALGQNVMVQIPKSYSCKKKIDYGFIFGVSSDPVDTDYISRDEWIIDYAFYRDREKFCDDTSANPVEVDYRYIGAFHGWIDEKGRLRSLPNKLPRTNITISTARNAAKQMGPGWSQLDFYLLRFIQMLYITEYGHPDSQTMIGRGYVDGNDGPTETGGTLQYGNRTYGETTGKKQMSYRGIEDLWGNVNNWVDGFILNRPNRGNISVSNKGFNDSGTGYETIGSTDNMLGGNIRQVRDEAELGFIPKTTGGSYENDGLYDYGSLFVDSYSTVARFAACGGNWANGPNAGAFYFRAHWSASGSDSTVGARLCL